MGLYLEIVIYVKVWRDEVWRDEVENTGSIAPQSCNQTPRLSPPGEAARRAGEGRKICANPVPDLQSLAEYPKFLDSENLPPYCALNI
jgi:hypothetical protein